MTPTFYSFLPTDEGEASPDLSTQSLAVPLPTLPLEAEAEAEAGGVSTLFVINFVPIGILPLKIILTLYYFYY